MAAAGPNQSPVQCELQNLPEGKASRGRGTDRSPSSGEVKNM
jgi:hypothetical protein